MRIGAVLGIAVGLVLTLGTPAFAAPVDLTVSTPSVSNAGTQSITSATTAPAVASGTYTQRLEQAWDPDLFRITAPSSIVSPGGWTSSYSTDGTTFTTTPPSTQAGWDAIRAIRTEGPLESRGTTGGRQIALRSASIPPPVAANFQGSSGGDGWDVFFDEHGRVFNIFHHATTGRLDCHLRDGTLCAGFSTPFTFPSGHGTPHQSAGWVDPDTDLLWYPTALSGTGANRLGFGCVDVSFTPAYPSGQPRNCATAFYPLAPGLGTVANFFDRIDGLAQVDDKLYARSSESGDLLCLDISNGQPCLNQPYDVDAVDQPVEFGDYVYFPAGRNVSGTFTGGIGCWDPSTDAWCGGWPRDGTTGLPSVTLTLSGLSDQSSHDHLYELPDANGTVIGICVESAGTRACVEPMGAASPGAALTGTYPFPGGLTATGIAWHNKEPVRSGARIYWIDGNYNTNEQLRCWDASLNSGAGGACAGWPRTENRGYALTVDPDNALCVWTNGDPGAIKIWDFDGTAGCASPPPVVEFEPNLVVPRMACDGTGAIRDWESFRLTAPLDSTYSTAVLTIIDSAGDPIAGWSNLPLTGSRTIDLTTLPVATTGQDPTFRITYGGRTSSAATDAEVIAIGETPQLCLDLQAYATPCPAMTAPSRYGSALPAVTTSLSGVGRAVPTSGPTEEFAAAAASVTMAAPADATCLGSIQGTASMTHDSSPVANVTVRLTDGSGAELARTATDASGVYTFERLAPGSGYRVEFGEAASGSADTVTAASATTDRSVAVGTATVVDGSYSRTRTNDLAGNADYGGSITLRPAPTNSSGVVDYDSFDHSATCIIDPADTVCRGSVDVAGQGTWSVDTSSGSITFTPIAGFHGSATSQRYRVTERASGIEAFASLSATIGEPPAERVAGEPAILRLKLTPNRRIVSTGQRVRILLRVTNVSDVTARDVHTCLRIPKGFRLPARAKRAALRTNRICVRLGDLAPGKAGSTKVTVFATSSRNRTTRFPGTASATNAGDVDAKAKTRTVHTRLQIRQHPSAVTG